MSASEKAPLDLRGIPCPLNLFQAKEALKALQPGQTIELLIDAGEPARTLPGQLGREGHHILDLRREGNSYLLRLQRGNGREEQEK